MKILELKPEESELYKLNEFINENIPNCDFRIELMVEEIFINIVKYSGCSNITVRINEDNTIQFIDNGIEFNPLKQKTTNKPKSIEEVEIGGLGIPLIKDIADEIIYNHINNENHLKIIKK